MTRRGKSGGWDRADGRAGGYGLLVEVGRGRGVALTGDGRFVRVRCDPSDEIGREIRLDRLSPRRGWTFWSAPRVARTRRPAFALSMVLMCLVLLVPLGAGRTLASGAPVAYVSVDVNPSLEFGVNRWDRAVTAAALNDKGADLLREMKWRGRLISNVVVDAARLALTMGYLHPSGSGLPGPGAAESAMIIVAAAPAAGRTAIPPGLREELTSAAGDLSGGSGGPSITVETLVGDAPSLRDEARRLGLSIGQYSVLLAAQEEGLELEVGDVERGLGKAIIAAGGRPGEVLREARQVEALSRLAEKFKERNGLGPDEKGDGDEEGPAGDGESGEDALKGDRDNGVPGGGQPGKGGGSPDGGQGLGQGATDPGQGATGPGQGAAGSDTGPPGLVGPGGKVAPPGLDKRSGDDVDDGGEGGEETGPGGGKARRPVNPHAGLHPGR